MPPSRSKSRDLLLVVCLLFARPHAVWFALGLVVFLLGLGFRAWSKGSLRRNRRLTTTGPYAFCRHPFYLANLVTDMGICLMSGVPVFVFLYVPVFLGAYRKAIRREEAFLAAEFGEAWSRYGAVPRLFPRWPADPDAIAANWSFQTLLREREVSRTLRLSALPFLLFLAGEVHVFWQEILEFEGLALIALVLFLHILGNLVHQTLERPESIRGRRLLPVFAGEVLLAFAMGGGLVAWVSPCSNDHTEVLGIARDLGARVILSENEFVQTANGPESGVFLVDDDVIERLAESSQLSSFVVTDFVWFRFEVYFVGFFTPGTLQAPLMPAGEEQGEYHPIHPRLPCRDTLPRFA